MDLVTILKVWNLNEAELIRSRLEAADFHPFIQNECWANALGGAADIRIQVPETEAADARAFLDAK